MLAGSSAAKAVGKIERAVARPVQASVSNVYSDGDRLDETYEL
jgi:hypothetical protein